MAKMSVFVFLALCVCTFAAPRHSDIVEWQGRIVGGEPANDDYFPYQAKIRAQDGTFLCSGAIVNQRWVVSVARCLQSRLPTETRVGVGSNTLSGGTLLFVMTIINHEAYNSNTLANNVAVIQTMSDIIYSTSVQPIFLNSIFTGGGVNVVLSGWGQSTPDGPIQDNLLFISAATITNNECRNRMLQHGVPHVFDGTLCTLPPAGQGACGGDGGGPVVFENRLVGLISWSIGCAQALPDICTRISTFRSWIVSRTG